MANQEAKEAGARLVATADNQGEADAFTTLTASPRRAWEGLREATG